MTRCLTAWSLHRLHGLRVCDVPFEAFGVEACAVIVRAVGDFDAIHVTSRHPRECFLLEASTGSSPDGMMTTGLTVCSLCFFITRCSHNVPFAQLVRVQPA